MARRRSVRRTKRSRRRPVMRRRSMKPRRRFSRRKGRPVPRIYNCQLKYVETKDNVSGNVSAGYGYYQMQANSIYDPDLSGVGHQPMGRDELADLYQSYCVTGITYHISCDAYTAGTTTSIDHFLGVIATNDPAGVISRGTSTSALMEQPACKWTYNPISGRRLLNGYIDCAKVVGLTRSQYINSDDYRALMGTNPAKSVAAHVWWGRPDGALSTTNADLCITLTYHVTLFDPVNFVQS